MRRTESIVFRVNATERAMADKLADALHRSRSDVVRLLLLGAFRELEQDKHEGASGVASREPNS